MTNVYYALLNIIKIYAYVLKHAFLIGTYVELCFSGFIRTSSSFVIVFIFTHFK